MSEQEDETRCTERLDDSQCLFDEGHPGMHEVPAGGNWNTAFHTFFRGDGHKPFALPVEISDQPGRWYDGYTKGRDDRGIWNEREWFEVEEVPMLLNALESRLAAAVQERDEARAEAGQWKVIYDETVAKANSLRSERNELAKKAALAPRLASRLDSMLTWFHAEDVDGRMQPMHQERKEQLACVVCQPYADVLADYASLSTDKEAAEEVVCTSLHVNKLNVLRKGTLLRCTLPTRNHPEWHRHDEDGKSVAWPPINVSDGSGVYDTTKPEYAHLIPESPHP